MKQGRPLSAHSSSIASSSEDFLIERVPFVHSTTTSQSNVLSSEEAIAVAMALHHLLPKLEQSDQEQMWQTHSRADAVARRDVIRSTEAK